MKLLLLIIAFQSCVLLRAEKARFDYYRVYRVYVGNNEQLDVMKQIEIFPNGYELWNEPREVGHEVEIVVPPHKFGEWSELIEQFEFKSVMKISNLQEKIDNETVSKRTRRRGDWGSYWELDEINLWLDELAAEFPGIVSIINAGESFEGRKIKGVKLSFKSQTSKPAVVLEGLIHSPEWISGATVTWILNQLLRSEDLAIQQVVQNYDWYVFPVINPDGYNYTWTTNRMWRKNRRPMNVLCYGVDLNRNWDSHHGEVGTVDSACHALYAGQRPFSEPETIGFSKFLMEIPNLHTYLSFHSFGQLLMLPYGYTADNPPRYDFLNQIGEAGLTAIQSRHGSVYRLGTISNIIYPASGVSVDWVYDELHPKFALAYELRDTGTHGGLLPADQIIPTAEETFDSVIAMLKKIEELEGGN